MELRYVFINIYTQTVKDGEKMILYNGKIYPEGEQERLLNSLEKDVNRTLEGFTLNSDKVIEAADRLARQLEMEGTELFSGADEGMIQLAADSLRGENLRFRLKRELGKNYGKESVYEPAYGLEEVKVRLAPLGVIFHIAAGNADVLPAFSVFEGLLTGNVNILKLPQGDSGITVEIFRRLLEDAPELAPYIYIFDTPSSDVKAMEKMAAIADGIAVWGGDEAVKAVRRLAHPGVKLIEWGHRLSFAYVSGFENKTAELTALAEHIISTKQLLCSSCQTIFIDTDKMSEVKEFCRELLPYLDSAAERLGFDEIGSYAEMTLRSYSARLENHIGRKQDRFILNGRRCSVTACTDSGLELSYMYGNVLAKPLPADDILPQLRKCKGYLQTAGLICAPSRRRQLTEILVRSGVNRIMRAGNMSATFCGEAHDGEYPLRRYKRVINTEV